MCNLAFLAFSVALTICYSILRYLEGPIQHSRRRLVTSKRHQPTQPNSQKAQLFSTFFVFFFGRGELRLWGRIIELLKVAIPLPKCLSFIPSMQNLWPPHQLRMKRSSRSCCKLSSSCEGTRHQTKTFHSSNSKPSAAAWYQKDKMELASLSLGSSLQSLSSTLVGSLWTRCFQIRSELDQGGPCNNRMIGGFGRSLGLALGSHSRNIGRF